MKLSRFVDPGIARKKTIIESSLDYNRDFVVPAQIEISESGICNRTCVFCPKSDPNYPNEAKFIDPMLVEKLTREVGELHYKGILVFSGFCEPLLDKNIYSLVQISRNNLPRAQIELVTNGDVLNVARMRRLLDSGLSTLIISAYDGEFQITKFQDMAREANIDINKLLIRPRWLPEQEDFGITLNNRAGAMDDAAHSIARVKEPIKMGCNYPFYAFFMDYNGDVLLCPHDWHKHLIIGNMRNERFVDVWTSQRIEEVRKRLHAQDRCFSPCDRCDVSGLIMGNDQYRGWVNLQS